MSNKYKIPDDLGILFSDFVALRELRDDYMQMPFGFNRACKAAKRAKRERDKFWKGVFKLYPELRTVDLSYNGATREITVKEEKTND